MTGQYHYRQVAALLNAIDVAYGWELPDDSLPRWHTTNLKSMVESRVRAGLTEQQRRRLDVCVA